MCCIVVRQGCLSQHGQSSRHWPNLAVEPEMHDEHTKLTLLSYLYSQLKRSAMIQHTHTHSPRISPIYLSPGSFWARDYSKQAAAVPCAQTSMLYTSLVIFFFFPELPFFWHEATSSVCQCLSVCLSSFPCVHLSCFFSSVLFSYIVIWRLDLFSSSSLARSLQRVYVGQDISLFKVWEERNRRKRRRRRWKIWQGHRPGRIPLL